MKQDQSEHGSSAPNAQDCVTEMQTHVNIALRLLAGERKFAQIAIGKSLLSRALDGRPPWTGGYPALEQAGSNSGQLGSSLRMCGSTARDSAFQELQMAARAIDTLQGLLEKQAPANNQDNLHFETRIESAPKYTRDWLQAQFSDQVKSARGEYSSESPSVPVSKVVAMDPKKSMDFKKSLSISGFDISDEILRAGLESVEITNFLSDAGALEFDTLAFSKLEHANRRGISILGVHLEAQRGLVRRMLSEGNIDPGKADAGSFEMAYLVFLTMIDQLYKPDALYHGAAHAMDVMSTAMWFMNTPIGLQNFRALDHFLVLVAAAVHDVGHPGVNNLFLTKTMDPIAIRYNDKSCLENMHVAIAFELMMKDGSGNWFAMLEKSSGPSNAQKNVREGLISMVLATDMSVHARYVTEMDKIIQDRKNREEGAVVDPKTLHAENMFLLDIIVHTSDISNPAKPRASMLAWTKRVNMEFWAQGDQEQKLGLDISPLCNRQSGRAALPKGQIGFISFVVMPFFTSIAQIIPEAKDAVDLLTTTLAFWKEMDQKGAAFDDIFEGVETSLVC